MIGTMTKTLIFDIETDGLLLDTTIMWVGVVKCIETNNIQVYRDPYKLSEELNSASLIVGHNIIGFDLPALFKLTKTKVTTPCIDTFILSKLVYYDRDRSFSHSLKAWGIRLKEYKGDYSDWSKYTKEMEEYCVQDVKTTSKLYSFLKGKAEWLPKKALEIEQDTQKIITQQYIDGWLLDINKAKKLHIELVEEQDNAIDKLYETFKNKFIPNGPVKIPKRKFRRLGVYTVGPNQPIKYTRFNPGSGVHIVWWVESVLGKQKWSLTEKGNPKTDSETLKEMFSKEDFIQPLLHYQEVTKLLGQLATADKAWLNLVDERDGRLHGSVDILGTVSGRATHSNPNMSQVPSVRAYKGKEARSLFIVPEDKVLVGCDLSGVELRCLAHYLYPYDKGEYARTILEGDIHTANQKNAGLPTRDDAKRFIYCTLYGGGAAKIGIVTNSSAKKGAEYQKKFLDGTTGYRQLVADIKKAAKNKYLRGITGRRLFVRSPHSALNVLLQSLGAYISKQWMIIIHKRLKEEGIKVKQLGWSHDEVNMECSPSDSENVAKILEESAIEAGEVLGIRMIIEAEAKTGKSWLDVH